MSSVVISGDTSGAITLAAPAIAGTNTLSLPAVTDTLVGLAATQTLTNKSIAATQLTGTIAAARLPTGSVLQVVSATYSTAVSIASASYTDTGLQASITPTSSSSKILILVNQAGGLRLNSTSEQSGYANLVRGATQITEIIQIQRMGATASQYAPYFNGIVFLDSPATTSSTLYKIQAKVAVTADTGVLYFQVNNLDSTITLMEIAA
jgi:hypothetical protein